LLVNTNRFNIRLLYKQKLIHILEFQILINITKTTEFIKESVNDTDRMTTGRLAISSAIEDRTHALVSAQINQKIKNMN